ncbi:MAG: hypothetical protein JWM81_666 [Candidatus Saccharibacteria bacterium]|nr:hypothetical protein [Candidatus Saccharibacteria bacterium]
MPNISNSQLATEFIPPMPRAAVEETAQFAVSPEREAQLKRLLDGPYGPEHNYANYEYALDSGLLDVFDYDAETGRDGIQHVLGGEVMKGEDGARIPEGFHHEPSAAFGITEPSSTYVDREHISSLNSKGRADLRETPFEPYKAKTVVAGLTKMTVQINLDSGETETVRAKNGMFPKEYDGLAVLQAVRLARDRRDVTKDVVNPSGNLVAESTVPMIDGTSLMRIRLVMDAQTQKVRSAFPIVKVGGIMKLSGEAIDATLQSTQKVR